MSLPPMLLVELYILDPAPRRVHHPLGGGVQLPRLRQPRELLELRHEGAEAVGRHEARRAALGHVAELLEVSLHTTHKRDTLELGTQKNVNSRLHLRLILQKLVLLQLL